MLQSEEGFSLLEVLITIITITVFLMLSIQATTITALLRVQAKRKTEAINYINNDKQLIEYIALSEPLNDDTLCNIASLRDYLKGEYDGTDNNSLTSTTIVESNEDITLLNKTYKLARIYTVLSNTLQVTWHIWDEGGNINDTNTNNPDISGNVSAGDSDDRSIAIMTTEILPNISVCQ